MSLGACTRARVCTHNLTWSQKTTLTSWKRLIEHLEKESFILPLLFSVHGRTLEKLVTELTEWIQGITSQFLHLTSSVCLITDQWGLSVTRSESVLSLVQPVLWQCYRSAYWCFGIAVGVVKASILRTSRHVSLGGFFSLCYPSNAGLSQRWIIPSPTFV